MRLGPDPSGVPPCRGVFNPGVGCHGAKVSRTSPSIPCRGCWCGLGLGWRVSLTQVLTPFRVDVAHLILYHLSICCKKKYFDFEREILPFASENWDSLLLGEVRAGPGRGLHMGGIPPSCLFFIVPGWTRSRSPRAPASCEEPRAFLCACGRYVKGQMGALGATEEQIGAASYPCPK